MLLKNRISLFTLFLLSTQLLIGQDYFLVRFKSKDSNYFKKFLSEKALQRRANQNIAIDVNDFPVSRSNIERLVATTAADVKLVSRWLNGVIIESDSAILSKIKSLDIVASLAWVGKSNMLSNSKNGLLQLQKTEALDYGNASYQIQSLQVDKMHEQGISGKGVLIAVFDGGFQNSNTVTSLTHLISDERIVYTYNIVERNTNVFTRHTHGTNVLSCMAGYLPGKIIGPAYGASYALFITEDVNSEKRIEEYYWLKAAEMADSIGADVISSSLGYNTFDNSAENHSLSELDGKTAIITLAAEMAVRKGILVVNSAGNNYNDPNWRNIVFPADGDSVLAVGAADPSGTKASFSAVGPTADKRIKPNVTAIGTGIAINGSGNTISTASGTSYSAPLVAGLAAGIWELDSTLTNIQLLKVIEQSAHLYCNPNNDMGHGVPDFVAAYHLIKENKTIDCLQAGLENSLYPNPVKDMLTLELSYMPSDTNFELYQLNGKEIMRGNLGIAGFMQLKLDISTLQTGIYLLKVGQSVYKLIKM